MMLDERPMQEGPRWPMAPALPMHGAAMSIDPIQTAPAYPAAPPAPAPSVSAPRPVPVSVPAPPRDEQVPSTEALAAVQVASEAYETLRRTGRELHFTTTDAGVLKIEVFDGFGRLVRSIPPNEALALASGEASWRA